MRILKYGMRRAYSPKGPRFSATLICEHCKRHVELHDAADDRFFKKEVLPSIVCAECKKNSAGELESAVTLDAARAKGITPVHM